MDLAKKHLVGETKAAFSTLICDVAKRVQAVSASRYNLSPVAEGLQASICSLIAHFSCCM